MDFEIKKLLSRLGLLPTRFVGGTSSRESLFLLRDRLRSGTRGTSSLRGDGIRRLGQRARLRGLAALAGVVLFALLRVVAAEAPEKSDTGLPAPAFSVPAGVYTNSVSVELTASSGVIRYTLNGAEPTTTSPEYSSPIELTNSTVIKAKVFQASSRSATAAQTYFLLDSDLAGFSSNLPLLMVSSFGQRVPYGRKVQVAARLIDNKGTRNTLAGPADFAGRGELNIRGNTSLRYPKHSYHFQTRDEGLRSPKVSLAGLPKESDWVLYAPYPDKTLMRDALGYELSNQIGRYAPRTRFVELFLSESGGRLSMRNYLGVYVLEDKIKRGKHRVDIARLGPEDNSEPAISGGYIFKKDHLDRVDEAEGFLSRGGAAAAKQQGFRSSQGNHFFYVEPKGNEITSAQKAWLRRYITAFEHVLYSDGFKDPKTGYAAFIDADSFIDHHLLVELSKNIDGFRFSTFYYKDRGGKLKMGPIWDWNLTFGNANARDGWVPEGWYWPQLDDQQYSWFRRLFEDPDFEQKYVDRWGELRANQFSVANLHARIDQMAALLNEAQARNFRRWRILGRSVWPNTYVGESFKDEVAWMKEWIRKRIDWMDRQFVVAPSISLKPGATGRGTKLELRAPAGRIYYTLDGTDPRAPGGGVLRAARSYSSAVVLNEPAVICCRVRQDKRWSPPVVTKCGPAEPPAASGSGKG